MKEDRKKGINSDTIPFLVRLPNAMYIEFRDVVSARGHTRISIIRLLIADYLRKQKGKKQVSPLA